jgi:hypothetical protein
VCRKSICVLEEHVTPHLQGGRISQARNQHEACSKADVHGGFLLGLLFYPENGDNMFFQNVGSFSTDYTSLYCRR